MHLVTPFKKSICNKLFHGIPLIIYDTKWSFNILTHGLIHLDKHSYALHGFQMC